MAAMYAARQGIFDPKDFLSAEAMGTDIPRRCATCRGCKECQFRARSLSFKEDREYLVIVDGLKFDEKKKQWIASYPFFDSPIILEDNYKQVNGFTDGLERRLIKEGSVSQPTKK